MTWRRKNLLYVDKAKTHSLQDLQNKLELVMHFVWKNVQSPKKLPFFVCLAKVNFGLSTVTPNKISFPYCLTTLRICSGELETFAVWGMQCLTTPLWSFCHCDFFFTGCKLGREIASTFNWSCKGCEIFWWFWTNSRRWWGSSLFDIHETLTNPWQTPDTCVQQLCPVCLLSLFVYWRSNKHIYIFVKKLQCKL